MNDAMESKMFTNEQAVFDHYDALKPLEKRATLTHYVDANVFYNALMGRSAVTGILHLANATPIEWYSKKQATVKTATYGSEVICQV